MPLQISVDGGPLKPARYVVLYDNKVPFAVAVDQGSAVFYADSARDKDELISTLLTLGIKVIPQLHADGGIIHGQVKK